MWYEESKGANNKWKEGQLMLKGECIKGEKQIKRTFQTNLSITDVV